MNNFLIIYLIAYPLIVISISGGLFINGKEITKKVRNNYYIPVLNKEIQEHELDWDFYSTYNPVQRKQETYCSSNTDTSKLTRIERFQYYYYQMIMEVIGIVFIAGLIGATKSKGTKSERQMSKHIEKNMWRGNTLFPIIYFIILPILYGLPVYFYG